MVTHYDGSKGPVEITSMAYRHLVSAHAKLVRERTSDARDAEIQAMAEEITRRDAEYIAEQAASGGGENLSDLVA